MSKLSKRREGRIKRRKEVEQGPKIRRKKLYRIKAHNSKGRLVLKKTRTKQPVATVKRIATLHDLNIDRIT